MKIWTLLSAAAAQALPEMGAAAVVTVVAQQHPLPAAVPVPEPLIAEWVVAAVVAVIPLSSGALPI